MNLAGRGPMPREDRSTIRFRGKPDKSWQTVENTPFLAGRSRELPPLPHGKGLWHGRTLAWWDNIRTMPHARLWTDTDWDFAIATARLHHEFWLGDMKVETGLRIRERLMGVTWEARQSAGIKYAEPEPDTAPLAEVTQLPAGPASPAKPAKASPRSRVRAIDPDGA